MYKLYIHFKEYEKIHIPVKSSFEERSARTNTGRFYQNPQSLQAMTVKPRRKDWALYLYFRDHPDDLIDQYNVRMVNYRIKF